MKKLIFRLEKERGTLLSAVKLGEIFPPNLSGELEIQHKTATDCMTEAISSLSNATDCMTEAISSLSNAIEILKDLDENQK